MPTVNFYLKKPEKISGKSLIYLQMRFGGKKIVYSTRQNIDPKKWDKKKQLVKARSTTTEDRTKNLNDYLTDLKEACEDAYYKELGKGSLPSVEKIKPYLEAAVYRNSGRKANANTFYSLIDQFISGTYGGKTLGTIKTYQTAKYNLENFEMKTGYRVDFETITPEFCSKYESYLSNERTVLKNGKKIKVPELSTNSIGKEIKNIKTFMAKAVDLDYTHNLKFKSFEKPKAETHHVALTTAEIQKLFRHDFSGNQRKEEIRDLFVLASNIGLRYGDLKKLRRENIVFENGYYLIKLIPEKTKKSNKGVTVPCNETVLKIFRKYQHRENWIPPVGPEPIYNKMIKEICREAGLTQTGRKMDELSKPLCDCVTSHTARRSYISNATAAGAPIELIRKTMGHSSSAMTEKYNKTDMNSIALMVADRLGIAQTEALN